MLLKLAVLTSCFQLSTLVLIGSGLFGEGEHFATIYSGRGGTMLCVLQVVLQYPA